MTREQVISVLRSPEGREETRRIHRLRRAYELVAQTIYAGDHSRAQVEELVDGLAGLAETYFPGSSETFAILYGRRLRRAIVETYGEAN